MSQKQRKKHHGGAATGVKEAQSALDRGRTLLAAGDPERAIVELARAWAGQKSDAARDALLEATRAAAPQMVRERPADAVPVLERAHHLSAGDLQLSRWLAAAYWGAGDLEAAGRVLGTLMETRPGEPEHRMALALVRAKQGHHATAAKLAADAGRAMPGRPAPEGEELHRIDENRDLLRLALAAQAPSADTLSALAAEGVSAEERAALVFSLTARQDAAVAWYTGAAAQTLNQALALGRERWEAQLCATVAPPVAQVPDVRGLLAHLADALEERLREASTPRASKRPREWVAVVAQALKNLRAAAANAQDPDAPATADIDAPATPRPVALVLATLRRAAAGEFEEAFAELVGAAGEVPAPASNAAGASISAVAGGEDAPRPTLRARTGLPRRAVKALARDLFPRLEREKLTEAMAGEIEAHLPELAHECRSHLAYRALIDRRFEESVRLFRLVPGAPPMERGMLAIALENLKRHDDAMTIWRDLVRTALDRRETSVLPNYAVTGLERMIAANRADDDRVVRQALGALPGRDDLWLYHASAMRDRGGTKYQRAAQELLEAYRPSVSAFHVARAIELVRLTGGPSALRQLAQHTGGDPSAGPGDLAAHALHVAGPEFRVAMALALLKLDDMPEAVAALRALQAPELARLTTEQAISVLCELFVDPAAKGFDQRLEAVLGSRATPQARSELLLVLIERLLREYQQEGNPLLGILSQRVIDLDVEDSRVRNAMRVLQAHSFRAYNLARTVATASESEEALENLTLRVKPLAARIAYEHENAERERLRSLVKDSSGAAIQAPDATAAVPHLGPAVAEALVSLVAHRLELELD